MFVTSDPAALVRRPRAVALGTFDGLHAGHRLVVGHTRVEDLVPTVVTFDPHPRRVLGRDVQLISSLHRRLELLAAAGAHDVLVVEFTAAISRLAPQEWADRVLRPIGTRRVAVGENFRFGHRALGDAETLRRMGFEVDVVPLSGGASSSLIRELVRAGELGAASELLGRPFEVEGTVVTRGSQQLSLSTDPRLLLPPTGTYLGRALGHRARVTIYADRIDLRFHSPVCAAHATPVRVDLTCTATFPVDHGAGLDPITVDDLAQTAPG